MRVKSIKSRDFTGGLNLRSNQFQLADNESPELLNMDVDPRGGVFTRRGVRPLVDPLGDPIHSVVQFHRLGAASDILVGSGAKVFRRAGASWDEVGTNGDDHPLSAAQFGDALYIASGGGSPTKRWDGDELKDLGLTFRDDFDQPWSGNAPRGEHVVAHNNHLWVAGTYEGAGGEFHPNRIRFSHPNNPEAWRSSDWFDVDPGVDGDQIVGLVPFQDHLIVFKRKSVYVVYGFDWESFYLQPVTREIGAVGPHAMAALPSGVVFFSDTGGIYAYDGKSLSWLFEAVQPAIDDGTIPPFRMSEVSVGWVRNRVWVSVPWIDEETQEHETRVLVYDPSLEKGGSWTLYDCPVTLPLGLRDMHADELWLGVIDGSLVEIEVFQRHYDDFGDGLGDRPIRTVFRTPWMDAGEVAVRKRFRRPWFVFHGTTNERIEIAVFRDYNLAQRRKTFYERVSRQGTAIPWDTDPPEQDPVKLWDEEPDPHEWGAEGKAHEIERGSTLGLARAVQLRFRGPEVMSPWGLNNITYTYSPKRLR